MASAMFQRISSPSEPKTVQAGLPCEFLVDSSSGGGTKECLAYAAAMKKEIFLLDPSTLEGQYVFRDGEWLDI